MYLQLDHPKVLQRRTNGPHLLWPDGKAWLSQCPCDLALSPSLTQIWISHPQSSTFEAQSRGFLDPYLDLFVGCHNTSLSRFSHPDFFFNVPGFARLDNFVPDLLLIASMGV
jgi:hypothetical protein